MPGLKISVRLVPVPLWWDHDTVHLCSRVSLVPGRTVKMLCLHLASPASSFYNHIFLWWYLCLRGTLYSFLSPLSKAIFMKGAIILPCWLPLVLRSHQLPGVLVSISIEQGVNLQCWSPMLSPQSSSLSTTWEPVRNEKSQVSSRLNQELWGGATNLHTLRFEKPSNLEQRL